MSLHSYALFKFARYRISIIVSVALHFVLISLYFIIDLHHRNSAEPMPGRFISTYIQNTAHTSVLSTHSTIRFKAKNQGKLEKNRKEIKPFQPIKMTTKDAQPNAAHPRTQTNTGQGGIAPLPKLLELIHNAIQDHQHYPEEATDADEVGTATIGFFLQPNGQIEHLTLLHSSGYDCLDQAALTAVNQAAPFKQAEYYMKKGTQIEIHITFQHNSELG